MTVQKVNNDLESRRMTRNLTDTQKKNTHNVKEGKIINSFVKDSQLSLDETLDTLVISRKGVDLPDKVFEKEPKRNNMPLYTTVASALVMALISGFTALIKRSSEKHLNSTKEYLLPGITRNHCINNEIHQSIFSMIQSPNRKTILASLGVIVLGSMAFMAKTFLDGYRDVWVKKQEANIQKNLQENLIAVETQAFSGKIQIIRSLLASKAKFFEENLSSDTIKTTTFKAKQEYSNEKKEKFLSVKTLAQVALTVAGITLLGYFALRNIRKSDEFVKKSIENTKTGLDNVIKVFNDGKDIQKIQDHDGNVLTGKDAYKHVISNMLESIYATPETVEEYINKLNLPDAEKIKFIKDLKSSMNQATEKVNSAIGGSGRNKITYFSHVNDYLSFFYDWLMNPNNPQFKNLFYGISGITALAYGGKTAVEAIKDVEVKKYNAETELNLQKRLVATELRNFKTKKESVIEPLCDEFILQKKNKKSATELKTIADNILFEIKNGPPFVYS